MFEYVCDRCGNDVKANHLWTVKFKYAAGDGIMTKHFCSKCKKIIDAAMELDEEEKKATPKKPSTYVKTKDFQEEVEGSTTEKKEKGKRKSELDLTHINDEVPHFVDFMNSLRNPIDFMDVKTAKKCIALRLDEQKVSLIAKYFSLPYARLYNFTEKYISYTRNIG